MNDHKMLSKLLTQWSSLVDHEVIKSIFAVALTLDGPTQCILVQPEDRESMISALNQELSRMFGTPHHIVETGKLERFCSRYGISEQDILEFMKSEEE